MSEEESKLSWIDNKIIYSLSLILILWTLNDFIISWFPKDFQIVILNIILIPKNILNLMILFLLGSIYFYGINYMIKNPLNKLKKYVNNLASILWFIFFIFPFFIITILFIQGISQNTEQLVTFISLIFAILGIIMSTWSQKKMREIDLSIIDNQIELLKIQSINKDSTSEFLRDYSILEYLLNRILIDKVKISIDYNKAINVVGLATFLSHEKFITQKTSIELKKLVELRNKIIHEGFKVSEKEVTQIKNIMKELEESFPNL